MDYAAAAKHGHAALLLALLSLALGGGLERPQAPPPASGPVLSVTAGNDGQGRAVLAWTSRSATFEQVHVARLDGRQWTRLGEVVNENPDYNATQLSVHAAPESGSEAIWLGWSEGSGLAHIDSYLLSHWTGQSKAAQSKTLQSRTTQGWSDPAPYALRRNLSDAGRSRAFTIDALGKPLVAWTDISVGVGTSAQRYPSVVILKTWQPEQQLWRSSPPLNVSLSAPASMPSVGADPASGAVTVAYIEGAVTQSNVQVRQWNGQGWKSLGGPLNVRPLSYIFGPKVRLDAKGRPVVAWLEDRGGLDALYVSRWTGAAWQRLDDRPAGRALSAPRQMAASVSLALTPAGDPVLAWTQGPDGARVPQAARWRAGRWQRLSLSTHVPRSDADSTSVVATSRGILIAWRELEEGQWQLRTELF